MSRNVNTLTFWSLSELDDQDLRIAEKEALRETADWIKNVIGKPDVRIGRPGPICPRVPRALQLNSTHLTVITRVPNETFLSDLTGTLAAAFELLPPYTMPDREFKTVGALFTAKCDEKLIAQLNDTQSKRKLEYVSKGLLLGKFHRYLDTYALHNKSFVPGRSPYPLLVFRVMLPSDIRFLAGSRAPGDERLRLLLEFARVQGPSLSGEFLELWRDAVRIASEEANK